MLENWREINSEGVLSHGQRTVPPKKKKRRKGKVECSRFVLEKKKDLFVVHGKLSEKTVYWNNSNIYVRKFFKIRISKEN